MSLKNKWRRRGRLEFRRETSRLSDGTPWGDVLWVRTIARNARKGRGVAYCNDRFDGKGVYGGLGCYIYPSPRNPVTVAKAMRRQALSALA